MKFFLMGFGVAGLLFTGLLVWLHTLGRSPSHSSAVPDAEFLEAIEWSSDSAALPSSPEQAALWVQGVKDCFAEFSVRNLERCLHRTYAERFYFRDAFHTVVKLDALSTYFLRSARMTPGVTFAYGPVAWTGKDAYLPWTMQLPDGQESLGVTQLRFNEEGRVLFHQDFWDSSDVLVPRVPVANGILELVRRKM